MNTDHIVVTAMAWLCVSGVAGVHGPAPEGDTDQRFTVCVASFPGLEFRLHQRYRITTIDVHSLFLFYFISFPCHNLSRES